MSRRLAILPLCVLLACGLWAQKRKNKKDEEPPTQVLPPLPEPPEAVVAETGRLSFQVSPLSAKGLLSQQVRDALKALMRDNHGVPIVKLRAFVAGSGDLRRVQAIVSEELTDRKQALPAISTIQVGALPMTGAQVVLESVSVEKKAVNPGGLVFFSASDAADAGAAVAQLQKAVSAASVRPANLLRVTCFLSSLDDGAALGSALAANFPNAAAHFVQMQRLGLQPQVACEAVGRLDSQPAAPQNGAASQFAVAVAPKLVFTATQLIFRDQDSDIRLAFQRLGKAMEPLGGAYKDVIWSGVYPLTRPLAAKIDALRFDFFDRARPPAGTMLLFEGLPSIDATAAIELVAAVH
jgi:enamine deaminase RidA (YjgF/YER057c/UK114 family)